MSSARILALAFAGATGLVCAASDAQTAASVIPTFDLGGLEARSAALLLSGQEAGDLETSFLAVALGSSGEGRSIALVVDLAGASLVESTDDEQMIVEVYAYALDAEGSLRATSTRAFRLDLAARRGFLESGGVKLMARIDLPGGVTAGSLRLLVLHRASGRLALRTLPIPALAATETPATPASLLVLEPGARWLAARGEQELPPPLADNRLLPATRLVAAAGGSLPLRLAIGADEALPAARLLDSTGQALGALDPVRMQAGTTDLPADLRLDLAAWGAGSYLLELSYPSEPERSVRLPLDLIADQLAEGAVWFDRTPAADEPVATDIRTPARGRSALQRMALSAYRRTFEAWQGGGLEAATAELRRFEAGAIGTADEGGEGIDIAQSGAAAELAAADPQSLVPLMCLHERLFRYYHAHESFLLATHSRRMALGLAQLYTERGGDRADRTSALVLVSLAGMRLRIGARLDALATFESAIEMDPRQPEALHALAALHESLGHYDTTVDLLRRLDRTGVLSPLAELRLAINLGRVGNNRPAVERLRALIDGPSEWISRLAFQELARLLAGSQRAEEALEVLVQARERFPDDQSLTIQQAALLDRLGKPLAGQRVLAGVDSQSGDRGETPRLRYSEPPLGEVEGARRRLARQAADRLAAVVETARTLQVEGAP